MTITPKQIAAQMGCSVQNVRHHIRAVLGQNRGHHRLTPTQANQIIQRMTQLKRRPHQTQTSTNPVPVPNPNKKVASPRSGLQPKVANEVSVPLTPKKPYFPFETFRERLPIINPDGPRCGFHLFPLPPLAAPGTD